MHLLYLLYFIAVLGCPTQQVRCYSALFKSRYSTKCKINEGKRTKNETANTLSKAKKSNIWTFFN